MFGRSSPLYGFVQLIDDGLEHRFVSCDVGPMKTSGEEGECSAFCVAARLKKKDTGLPCACVAGADGCFQS